MRSNWQTYKTKSMTANMLHTLLFMALLLMVGCKDYDEDDALESYRQDNPEILVKETSALRLQPEDFTANAYDGMIVTDKPWDGLSPTALSIFHVLAKTMGGIFDNFIAEQVPALDKLFEAKAGVAGQGGHNWQIESYVFNYRSKSARGEDVVLTGRVTFPNAIAEGAGHQVKSLTLFMHHAVPIVGLMPSQVLDLWTLRTFYNEAIIQPDGQGLGANLDEDYYCTVSSNVLARQMADCALAALEVMRRHGVTLADNGHSICSGCSLGAATPLAFAKYYETEASPSFRQAIKLDAVYTGCGPVDYAACIRYFSDHPESNAMLSKSMVFSLAALTPNQLYGYRAQDFVNPTMLNTQVEYEGRMMSYYEAEAKYFVNALGTNKNMPNPKKLSEILAPDMLTQDGQLDGNSPKTQALLRVLAEQGNLSGWLPTTNIYLVHGQQDDAIPVQQIRKCYEALSNGGELPNVHYRETSVLPLFAELVKLPKAGLMHLIAAVPLIDIYMKEDPSKEFKK